MALTDTLIRKIKPTEKDQRLHDGKGLYLLVRKSGTKTFLYRVRKPVDTFTTIGNYPAVSLAEARAYVANMKLQSDLVKTKIDKNTDTFKDVAERYLSENHARWSPGYARQIRKSFDNDVYPHVGGKLIADINSQDCLILLRKIQERGALSVAKNCKVWMSAVFKYAIANLFIKIDPTQALSGTIQKKKVKHHPALSERDFQKLLRDIEKCNATVTTRLAIKAISLTFVRTAELRYANWDEFDFEMRVWKIPSSRMKRSIPHIVPLSQQALDVFQQLYAISQGEKYIIVSSKDRSNPINPTTLNTAISRTPWRNKFSMHAFRTTASTLLNQNNFRSDLIERQLAHSSSNTIRGIYNHADYLEERREMMDFWGGYIEDLIAS